MHLTLPPGVHCVPYINCKALARRHLRRYNAKPFAPLPPPLVLDYNRRCNPPCRRSIIWIDNVLGDLVSLLEWINAPHLLSPNFIISSHSCIVWCASLLHTITLRIYSCGWCAHQATPKVEMQSFINHSSGDMGPPDLTEERPCERLPKLNSAFCISYPLNATLKTMVAIPDFMTPTVNWTRWIWDWSRSPWLACIDAWSVQFLKTPCTPWLSHQIQTAGHKLYIIEQIE